MSLLFQLVLMALFSYIGLVHGTQKYFTVDGIKKCESKSPELNECVKGNAKLLWPRLIQGVKEFDIPSIDPFNISQSVFSFSGELGNCSVSNVTVIGLAGLVLKSVDVKVSNQKITVNGNMSLCKLTFVGNYSGYDKELSTPIMGNFSLLIDDFDIETNAEADISSRDGHTFAKITNLNVITKAGTVFLDADELFYDPLPIKMASHAISYKYSQTFHDFLISQTRKYWQPYILEFVNKILNVTPLERAIDL